MNTKLLVFFVWVLFAGLTIAMMGPWHGLIAVIVVSILALLLRWVGHAVFDTKAVKEASPEFLESTNPKQNEAS